MVPVLGKPRSMMFIPIFVHGLERGSTRTSISLRRYQRDIDVKWVGCERERLGTREGSAQSHDAQVIGAKLVAIEDGISDQLPGFTLVQPQTLTGVVMKKLAFAELSIAVLASSSAFSEGKTRRLPIPILS
jgi:hypothetical protein